DQRIPWLCGHRRGRVVRDMHPVAHRLRAEQAGHYPDGRGIGRAPKAGQGESRPRLRLFMDTKWRNHQWLMRGLAALVCSLAFSARGYPLLSSNQLVFVNVDHAPVGAYSTFLYGSKGDHCGFGFSSSSAPYGNGGGGLVVALSGGGSLQVLP